MSSKFLGLARTAGIQTCIWSKQGTYYTNFLVWMDSKRNLIGCRKIVNEKKNTGWFTYVSEHTLNSRSTLNLDVFEETFNILESKVLQVGTQVPLVGFRYFQFSHKVYSLSSHEPIRSMKKKQNNCEFADSFRVFFARNYLFFFFA